MAIPNFDNLNDFYSSPTTSPIYFYSVKDIDPNATETDGLVGYAYRQYIYKAIDYDASKRLRTGTPEEIAANLELPATSSGSYVAASGGLNGGKYVQLSDGVYVIEYVTMTTRYRYDTPTNEYQIVSRNLGSYIYPALAIATDYPALNPYTITDVIVRCCEQLEPLRRVNGVWQKPRFRLEGVNYGSDGKVSGYDTNSLADKYSKITAPEFTFTKMTFREQMQMVGGYIHAEPRLTEVSFEPSSKHIGGKWFTLSFDEYGSSQMSDISSKKCISKVCRTDINEYCTSIDSSVDNMISQIDASSGSLTEPFIGSPRTNWYAGKSLRTETVTKRISDNDDSVISTQEPIYAVQKVMLTYFAPNSENPDISADGIVRYDITPYIFEKTEYDNLSSYDGVYPYSKSYALCYTQGEKNIRGLFFKVENAINEYLSDYAIVNIIKTVAGVDIENSFSDLSFEVTYLPITSTRATAHKQNVKKGIPRTLAYNQSGNVIETRYYGENMKGVVEKLGNAQKIYTYLLAKPSQIPTIGHKFDDEYYISYTKSEIRPTHVICTVGLTKNFNNISAYVGINSNKRMWEVSERQAFERDTVINDYLLITETSQSDDEGVLIDKTTLFNDTPPVSAVSIRNYNESGGTVGVGNLILPVKRAIMGNTFQLSFQYEDNYNAGQRARYISGNDNNVSGVWASYVPYNDYYGRFDYTTFIFYANYINAGGNVLYATPQGVIENGDAINKEVAIRYQKDNREIPHIIYQLTSVTDVKGLIIGPAFMRSMSVVSGEGGDGVSVIGYLYGFNEKLNAFGTNVPTNGTRIGSFIIMSDTISITGVSGYESWGILNDKQELIIGYNPPNGTTAKNTTLYLVAKQSVE